MTSGRKETCLSFWMAEELVSFYLGKFWYWVLHYNGWFGWPLLKFNFIRRRSHVWDISTLFSFCQIPHTRLHLVSVDFDGIWYQSHFYTNYVFDNLLVWYEVDFDYHFDMRLTLIWGWLHCGTNPGGLALYYWTTILYNINK